MERGTDKRWKRRQRIILDAAPRGAAFTLVEIMVVIAIMGIVMTIAIPTIYQQLHPDSMRKAVSEVLEACSRARERAILEGTEVCLEIRPVDRQFSLGVGSSKPSAPQPNDLFSPDVQGNEWRMPPREPSKSSVPHDNFFPLKLSNRIGIEGVGLNGDDYSEDEIVRVHFFPNGISDELEMVLVSDKGERRKISLDVATALADVDSDLNKFLQK